jgi:aminoglycoside phosphotransferase (APT) family kinase protein
VQQVGDWLKENLPEGQPTTIVHGDYRLGNVMVANDAPGRVVAIFDWELSTLGDPLADVGYMTVTWVERDDPTGNMWSLPGAVTRQEGFPTRDELVALYEERSGRSVSDLRWYQALALWKASVFMEGNFKRFKAGNSDDEYLAAFDEGVPALADAAWEAANAPAPRT